MSFYLKHNLSKCTGPTANGCCFKVIRREYFRSSDRTKKKICNCFFSSFSAPADDKEGDGPSQVGSETST